MAKLKIRIFKNNDTTPDTTVTIPLRLLKIASKMIPKKVADALDQQGIDLDQIVALSLNDEPLGTVVEIEEHKKDRKIVISVE